MPILVAPCTVYPPKVDLIRRSLRIPTQGYFPPMPNLMMALANYSVGTANFIRTMPNYANFVTKLTAFVMGLAQFSMELPNLVTNIGQEAITDTDPPLE